MLTINIVFIGLLAFIFAFCIHPMIVSFRKMCIYIFRFICNLILPYKSYKTDITIVGDEFGVDRHYELTFDCGDTLRRSLKSYSAWYDRAIKPTFQSLDAFLHKVYKKSVKRSIVYDSSAYVVTSTSVEIPDKGMCKIHLTVYSTKGVSFLWFDHDEFNNEFRRSLYYCHLVEFIKARFKIEDGS